MNEYIVWAGCIQSAHLMNQGSCEFDANCDVFDPHTDAGCNTEAVFANITAALAKHGNSVGKSFASMASKLLLLKVMLGEFA